MILTPEAIGGICAAVTAVAGAIGGKEWQSRRHRRITQYPCGQHGVVCVKLDEVRSDVADVKKDLHEFMGEMRAYIDEAFAVLRNHEGGIGRLRGVASKSADDDTRS